MKQHGLGHTSRHVIANDLCDEINVRKARGTPCTLNKVNYPKSRPEFLRSARRWRCAWVTSVAASSSLGGKELGKSGIVVSRIGLGTIKWGDPGQGFGAKFSEGELAACFQRAVDGGINFFDTAEVYGYQSIQAGKSSESILGQAIASHKRKDIVVGTKFFTIPWTNLLVGGGLRLGRSSIREALTASLQRLGKVDLYQVHFPFPTMPQTVIADALQELLENGLVKAVGVCNYDTKQLRELNGLLERKNTSLATNQVKCSLLERKALQSDLRSTCEDLGITLVAHSPLDTGKLTDRYLNQLKDGEKLRPLLKLLQFIGAVYGGKSIAQVALNYLCAKGALPIPGASGVEQVSDQVEALKWELEENEVAAIDEKLASLNM